MNSLSWTIYLIYLMGNIHPLMISIGVVFTLFNVGCVIYHAAALGDYPPPKGDKADQHRSKRLEAAKRLAFGLPILFALGSIMPDKQTAVLIAASQVGEKLITSEKVTSVVDPSVDLLKTWIQNELNEQKGRLSNTAKDAASLATKAAKEKVTEEIAKKLSDAAK